MKIPQSGSWMSFLAETLMIRGNLEHFDQFVFFALNSLASKFARYLRVTICAKMMQNPYLAAGSST